LHNQLAHIATGPQYTAVFPTHRQIDKQKRGCIGIIGRRQLRISRAPKEAIQLADWILEAGDQLPVDFVCDVYPKWLAPVREDPSWEIGHCTGPVPFAIVIRDFFLSLKPFFVSVSSRAVLSGRALHIASKPGQDAEFKNTDFLLRTWLNAYCVRLSHFLVWLGSHYTLTGGSLCEP
jgi:hypothetical protein